MQKLSYSLMLILVLLVATSCAECASLHTQRQRSAARQQQTSLSPSPTGYPAAGETPQVPFELPDANTVKPDVSYLPPDNTYGPPSPDNAYGPPPLSPTAKENDNQAPQPEVNDQPLPADAPEKSDTNDDEQEQEVVVEYAADGSVIAISTSFDQDAVNESGNKARLVYQRFPQPRRRQSPTSESFAARSARLQKPTNLRALQSAQAFAYTAQLQQW